MIVNPVQTAVADQFAVLVLGPMLVQETERGAQAAAIDELHHGEQLFQLVFERSAREHEGVAAFQLFDGARSGGGPVTDALGFIEDDEVRREFVHVAHVLQDQFVAGEVEELRRGVQFAPPGQQSFDHLRRKSGELFDLRFPLVLYRGGSHHQHPLNAPAAAQHFGSGQGLNGFAQAHVIGQDHAAPASGEDGAQFLVGQKFCLQDSVQRIPSTPQLCQKLAFQIQSVGELILPVKILQHVAVDDRIEVGLTEALDHSMETPEMLRAEQAGGIEVLFGQLPQGGRWIGGKPQSDGNRFAVLQRDGGARPRKLAAFESPAVAFAKPQQERLDVLAGPQRIDGEVRARAIVLEQTRPAHGHAVSLPAGGLDAIIAVRLSARPFQDLGDCAGRPFPPLCYLLLD